MAEGRVLCKAEEWGLGGRMRSRVRGCGPRLPALLSVPSVGPSSQGTPGTASLWVRVARGFLAWEHARMGAPTLCSRLPLALPARPCSWREARPAGLRDSLLEPWDGGTSQLVGQPLLLWGPHSFLPCTEGVVADGGESPRLDSSFTDKETILVWLSPEAEPETGFECK